MNTQSQRVVVSLLIAAVCVGLSFSLFQFYRNSIDQQITNDLRKVQEATEKIIEEHLNQHFLDLQRMASRWAFRGSMDYETWLNDARNYVNDFPGFQAIEWIDTEFYVRWVEPLKGNESVLNMLSAFDQRRMSALEQARDNGTPVFTKTIDLVQGGKGFLLYVPIIGVSDKKFHGFILGVYRVHDLIDQILKHYAHQYQITLEEEGELIFKRGPSNVAQQFASGSVKVGNNNWDLKVSPSVDMIDATRSFIPMVVLVGGLCLSVLLSMLVYTVSKTASMNKDLAQLRDDLSRSNSALDVFASTASHDLKAPLRHMTTYADFIEEDLGDAINEDVSEHIVGLRRSAKRMHDLVEAILQYSRVDGAIHAHEECDLNEICAEVLQDLASEIADSQAVVTCGKLPLVRGDASQWRQVLQNLIANAVDYRREDETLQIDINCTKRGGKYEIYVRDNGKGFNQEDADKVFIPFKRLVPQHEGSGSGIGLSTVHKIIDRHDAQIQAQAEPGQGAVFTITLPSSRVLRFNSTET